MSSLTTSINLLLGLPRFLFPGNSILSILLPIYPSSLLCTCPKPPHFSPSCVFLQTIPPALTLWCTLSPPLPRHFHCAVNLPLIHTHVSCLSPIDFHSSSLQNISPALQLIFYPFLPLAAYHNVICKHHGPWSFLSDIIRHPIHHHCKETRAQSRSLVQSHLHLEPLRHSYRTPHRCYIVIVHILYYSHILLCHSRLSHAILHLFSWHVVIRFLQVHKHTM